MYAHVRPAMLAPITRISREWTVGNEDAMKMIRNEIRTYALYLVKFDELFYWPNHFQFISHFAKYQVLKVWEDQKCYGNTKGPMRPCYDRNSILIFGRLWTPLYQGTRLKKPER